MSKGENNMTGKIGFIKIDYETKTTENRPEIVEPEITARKTTKYVS